MELPLHNAQATYKFSLLLDRGRGEESRRVRCVAARVRQGCHNVLRADVLRRFGRSWENFNRHYRPLADQWEIYDNSQRTPQLLETGP